MNFSDIKEDIKSFADDESDMIFEKDGTILFTRNGNDEHIRVYENEENGAFYVETQGITLSYRKYLSSYLAKLEIFANKLIEKRGKIDAYVDGDAKLLSGHSEKIDKSLTILEDEASDFLVAATKLTFITADAGHGKTALLKEFQFKQASGFLKGENKYLFWHVDLQGRELVRLAEAIMYDLGELRVPGLFYSSILTLLKRKLLVLAIDGFDELAAEIGGLTAVGALSSLVTQMENRGNIIAASRRTFFDTQDYVKRTKILQRSLSNDCLINEIKLQPWNKDEVTEFAGYFHDNASNVYNELLIELGNDKNHPILTRPFLVTKVIEGMQEADMSASEFIGAISGPMEGISTVVTAFIKREVIKWKQRDAKTGNPYLTFEQHLKLLQQVAYEMWIERSDKISVEEVQLITTLLCEDEDIDYTLQPMIINMVKSHAFLIPTNNNDRKFEHEEFKNYFLSTYLVESIKGISMNGHSKNLKKFLSISQLPDSVAQYAFNTLNQYELDVHVIVEKLSSIVSEEWKPTYLQTNVGTLIPYLLDRQTLSGNIEIDAQVSYTSLIFENRTLNNIQIRNGNFINVSFRNTTLSNLIFDNCAFNELRIHENTNDITNVHIDTSCSVDAIVVYRDGAVYNSIYSPTIISERLIELNLRRPNSVIEIKKIKQTTKTNKIATKILNSFHRSTTLFKKNIEEDGFYSQDRTLIFNKIIPLLEKYKIIKTVDSTASKQANSVAWRLNYPLSDVFEADSNNNSLIESNLRNFWLDINEES